MQSCSQCFFYLPSLMERDKGWGDNNDGPRFFFVCVRRTDEERIIFLSIFHFFPFTFLISSPLEGED